MANLEQTIENTMDSLSEYEDLDGNSKSWLVDGLLDILDDIHTKEEGWIEGRYYEQVMYLVSNGAPIPKLFQTVDVGSALTDETYKLKVMMILDVRMNDDGNIVMDFLAKKIRNKK